MSRSTRIAAVVALFVAVEVVYVATTCPTYFLVDCPELNAAAAEWGVPHPPGYPLYTLLGGIAIRSLPFADAGFCMNLMTGFFAAIAAAIVFASLLRLSQSVWVATAGATGLAIGTSVWSLATVSEVYTLELMLLAALLASIARVFDSESQTAARWLCAATLVFGFALAHRSVTTLLAPILLYGALHAHGRELLRPARLAGLGLLALSPLSVYVYLPLAAAADPIINIGEPTTLGRIWDITSGKAFKHLLLASGDAGFYGRRLVLYLSNLPKELGLLLLLLPLGVLEMARHHRPLLLCTAYLLLVNIAWSVAYNIYDIQTHVLPSFLAMTTIGAMGLQWIIARLRGSGIARGVAAALALGNAGLLLLLNYEESNRRDNTIGPHYAHDMLEPVEEKSAVLSRIPPTTYVLWAAQILDGVKPRAANIDPAFASDWYSAQLERRFGQSLGLDIPEGSPTRDHFAFQFIVRNAARVPVYLGTSLDVFFDDPQARRELRGRWTSVPIGLLHLVVPAADLAERRDALIDRNFAFWKRAVPAFRALPAIAEDHETISVKLRYPQGLYDGARFCIASGRMKEARELLAAFVGLGIEERTARYNEYWRERGYDDRDAPPYGESGRRLLQDIEDAPDRTAPPPPDFDMLYVRAVDLFREGKHDESRDLLLELQKRRPESPDVRFSLACIAAEKKHDPRAIELLEQVIATQPEFDAAYPMLAEIYIRTGQLDRAASTVERFLKVRPGDPDALSFKARIDGLRKQR